ncbi:biotin--[acetyl-CoA-carboxylase] ligase [Chitinimonas arctica]|uniref:Bifunctional ligase/repressor BirA n=1 Tax=Chitinimonas arctica TaxID=2594795 RepID=A0A516SEK0_9NEIS|nr:biotin--[acetyl-CoA-carboxylase] ligase [Chitinimonas arctica]QDQ26563.1 biotin--[acetyl-CoA-carboxylase] ligase [Chitinimonas arctica]
MNPFVCLRLLDHEHFRPGPELAEALGISRASVSLAMKGAAELGVEVHTVKGRGYRLARPIAWLDEATVAGHLGERARFFDLRVFDEIGSTNTELMAAATQGAPAGLVYAAERQHAGRGRRGRRWQGEPGDALMFSLLWRFNLGVADLSGLSLAVGLAVARALAVLGVPEALLKWPNDIVTATGAKLGGILIELAGEAHGPSSVVIGIGLNMRLSESVRLGLDQPAESLALLGYSGDRNRLLAAVLAELAVLLPAFEQTGFAPLLPEWESRHAMQGVPARLLMPNGEQLDGLALGVANDGALRFQTRAGERQVHAGEVSLRRAQ